MTTNSLSSQTEFLSVTTVALGAPLDGSPFLEKRRSLLFTSPTFLEEMVDSWPFLATVWSLIQAGNAKLVLALM